MTISCAVGLVEVRIGLGSRVQEISLGHRVVNKGMIPNKILGTRPFLPGGSATPGKPKAPCNPTE